MTRFSEEWYARRQMATRSQSAFASLVLPWPESVNHSTRPDGSGGRILTDKHKAFREEVAMRVTAAGWGALSGRLRVTMHASAPDARKRDLDNLQKAILDALQHAGLYADDSAIDDLRILRTVGVPGTITVFIEVIA